MPIPSSVLSNKDDELHVNLIEDIERLLPSKYTI